jgi:hypothetical protein
MRGLRQGGRPGSRTLCGRPAKFQVSCPIWSLLMCGTHARPYRLAAESDALGSAGGLFGRNRRIIVTAIEEAKP